VDDRADGRVELEPLAALELQRLAPVRAAADVAVQLGVAVQHGRRDRRLGLARGWRLQLQVGPDLGLGARPSARLRAREKAPQHRDQRRPRVPHGGNVTAPRRRHHAWRLRSPWYNARVEPLPSPARRVFCNRTLNMRSIRAVGCDMDYTLV